MRPSNEAPGAEPRRLGSYTTAKVSAGRVERIELHVARLRRDAERLGLPPPDARAVERLFLESARATFGRGDGIIRVEWSCREGEAPALEARPRPFVPLGDAWRAVTAETIHPGPERRANTKFVDVGAYDRGRAQVASSDVDEVLLFDADGFLVEGSHSNVLVVTQAGHLVTPALPLGAVEGLGMQVLRHGRSIEEARLRASDLASAREILCVNAVRGVVPLCELDGRALALPEDGGMAARLSSVFGGR
ncbi:MAG: aminotransferase class IV [Myxococcota bacterium]